MCKDGERQGKSVKKGFIKGEALRLLRTNCSKKVFEEKNKVFKSHLLLLQVTPGEANSTDS